MKITFECPDELLEAFAQVIEHPLIVIERGACTETELKALEVADKLHKVIQSAYNKEEAYDRHGGPYDRGGADSYYRRGRDPHYFVGDSYNTPKITAENMTEKQIQEYNAGYDDNEKTGVFDD